MANIGLVTGKSSDRRNIQRTLDTILVSLGWLSILLVSNITPAFLRSNSRSVWLTIVGSVVTLLFMERRGLYVGRPELPRTEEISRVFIAVIAGAASVTVFSAFANWSIGAWELLAGTTLIFTCRMLSRGFIRALAPDFAVLRRPEPVVIVGAGEEARELAELILDHPESNFDLRGVIGNLSVAERSGLDSYWIGPTTRLVELMHQHEATGAVITATGFRGQQFRNLTRELFDAQYDVHLTTGVSRMWEGRFEVRSLTHEPLIFMSNNSVARWQLRIKRLLDIVGSIVALTMAAPIMGIAAIAIWLEDRGSLTYTSQRVGVGGEPFPMLKFRSMVADAEKLKAQLESENERTGPLFKLSHDPRITKVGRILRETSIDELPQLWNVLKGDMSLVGPRPALPEEEKVFDEELRDRFEVRPGITGLWQVEARSNAAFNAYRRLDLHYVENWTISLDLRILLATVEQVVVTLALLPMRVVRRSGAATDAISSETTSDDKRKKPALVASLPPADVIDLRDRSRERLAAELTNQRETVIDLREDDNVRTSRPAVSE